MTTLYNHQGLPGEIGYPQQGYLNNRFADNQAGFLNSQTDLNQSIYTPEHSGVIQPPGSNPVQTSDHSHCLPSNHSKADKVIFRPLEGKFHRNRDFLKEMDPYCKFRIGWRTGSTKTAWNEGQNPRWPDEVILKRKHNRRFAHVKVGDKDFGFHSYDRIGEARIDLNEVAIKGKVKEWFPVYHWGRVAGEIFIEIEYIHSDA